MGPPSLLEPALNTSLFIYLFSLFWGCHRPSRQDAGILQSSGTLPEQRSRGVCRGRGAHPLALLSQCLLHQAGAGGCRRQVRCGRQIRLPPAWRTLGFAYREGGRMGGKAFRAVPVGRVAPGSGLGAVTCSGGSSTKLHVKGKPNGVTPRCPLRASHNHP